MPSRDLPPRRIFRVSARRKTHSHRRTWTGFERLEDRRLLSAFTVINTGGGTGPGTLYDAITQANNHPNDNGVPDVIDFKIPDAGINGVETIVLTVPLPDITDPVTINGETQGLYAAGQPKVVIDGSQAGPETDGLTFVVGGNTVEGLVIDNFHGVGGNGNAIVLDGTADPGHGNIIEANFLGTDATGTQSEPNQSGILLVNSSHNFIGGLNANGQLVNGNLISGNTESGIFINDQASTRNDIVGNYIGTDVTGLHAVANGLDGVFVGTAEYDPAAGFASGNSISALDPDSDEVDPNGRNVIAGNTHNGVYILGGSDNRVQGNYIGLGADGATPIPNGEDGVRIEDASANTVGGTATDTGNVISANTRNGIEIVADAVSENLVAMPLLLQDAEDNVVQGNSIGTDASGTFSDPDKMPGSGDELGNGQDGIALSDDLPAGLVTDNTIGGADGDDGQADGVVKARNVISGNGDDGILLGANRASSPTRSRGTRSGPTSPARVRSRTPTSAFSSTRLPSTRRVHRGT